MRSRAARSIVVIGCGLASLWGVAAAQTHKVGVFFDTGASVCTAEVRNFAPPVRAYIYALVPDSTEVNGALISLALPSGFIVSDVTAPKDGILDGTLVSSNGLSITIQTCPVAVGPVLLLSFDLYQFDTSLDPGARVADVLLELQGGVLQADSLRFEKSQVKICPEDPINGKPELVTADPIRSTLNCNSDCPCTTPVGKRTWADVKRLFRGR